MFPDGRAGRGTGVDSSRAERRCHANQGKALPCLKYPETHQGRIESLSLQLVVVQASEQDFGVCL